MEQKVGEQLKSLRESKNISLKTLSQKTKIGISILQSLEEDRYENLPNQIYVRGFIKTYASILNVDERPLITKFDSIFVVKEPIENLKYAPQPGAAKKNPVPTIITTALLTGVIGFLGIFFIYKNSQHKLKEIKPIVIKKVIPAPPKEIPLPPPKIEPVTDDPNLPKNIQNAMVAGKQNLFLNAHKDDTWITYKVDNDPIKKYTLVKGKTLLLRGDEIRLFIGNVNSTLIFLNNRPVEVQSKSGVKNLVFPEINRSKYKIPLFVFNEDGTVTTSDDPVQPAVKEQSPQAQ